MSIVLWRVCFFFQAEDGIRDLTVTGVQTCALPIYEAFLVRMHELDRIFDRDDVHAARLVDEIDDGRKRGRFPRAGWTGDEHEADRKSTRLNSSHSQISYAVFCLKKKKKKKNKRVHK